MKSRTRKELENEFIINQDSNNEIDNEVDSNDEVDNEIDNEVDSDNEIDSEVHSDTDVDNEVDSEVDSDIDLNSNIDLNSDLDSNSEYNSDSLEEFTSSEDSKDEEEYFGDDNIFLESSAEEDAWADSESDEEVLREKHKNEAGWINNKKFKKASTLQTSSLKISFTPCLFKANYNIKLLLNSDPYLYIVDTMNIIYILKDYKLVSTYKIDRWSVSSLCFYNGKLLISSIKSNKLKYISDSQLIDINKIYTRNIHKLLSIGSYLYILGDTTLCINKDLEIQEESFNKIINMVEYKDFLLGLNTNGDILQFTPDLKLVNKIIYEDKFSFKNIKILSNVLVIESVNLIFINDEFEIIKEVSGDDVLEYKGLYLCSTRSGIKILNGDFNVIKMFKKTCSRFCNDKDTVLMCSFREVHSLEINSK